MFGGFMARSVKSRSAWRVRSVWVTGSRFAFGFLENSIFNCPLISMPDAVSEAEMRLPSQGLEAADIEYFSGSSIRHGRIGFDLSLEAHCFADHFCEFQDRTVFARSHIDGFGFFVFFHQQ